ncbi:bifunctional RNase H/acid phosphatase [Ornithinicoccus halotolerans]|uniref:bifunctional RNase H/acid phosphatase n=1 Tax=Ornithinicoccus halotolerans TaxID=1748220 RepID=UPI001295E460|nr:bifunctional RNase H/acid phosphatase [Ornithinicoccus halotolerans]
MSPSPSGRPSRLVVEADGGSRGNPGVAGYGALVRDPDAGRVLAERAGPLGHASNNVAEYEGLLAGLQAVLELGLVDLPVEVRMDSQLVIEQMAGRWRIKHEDMRQRARRAQDLVRQLEAAGGSVTWSWIRRGENAGADALANQGMDGQTVARDGWQQPDPVAEADATFGPSVVPLTEELVSGETTPTLEGACRLVLVRHGVTDLTDARALDGRGGLDPDLNDRGLAQARAAAVAVHELLARSEPGPISVLSSSLARARRTGGAVAAELGVRCETDADWDEQSFGDWDGKTMAELARSYPQELLRLRRDADYARPGGETHRELAARVATALRRAAARGGTVVVATHRKPVMCVLAQVLGIDHERAWSLATAPASLTALELWPDGAVQVAFVNDTHHLRGLE